jgi:hypothetical protein
VTVYATVDDLQDRYPRELTSAESDRAELLLEDASLLLDARVPGLADTTDGQVAALARLTVIEMVRRALSGNIADGVKSETAGVFSVTYRDDNLFVYDRELDVLMALLMPNRATAVSVRSPGL